MKRRNDGMTQKNEKTKQQKRKKFKAQAANKYCPKEI